MPDVRPINRVGDLLDTVAGWHAQLAFGKLAEEGLNALEQLKPAAESLNATDRVQFERSISTIGGLLSRRVESSIPSVLVSTEPEKPSVKRTASVKNRVRRPNSTRAKGESPSPVPTAKLKRTGVNGKMIASLEVLLQTETPDLPKTLGGFLAKVYGRRWKSRAWVNTYHRNPVRTTLGEEISKEDSNFRKQFRMAFSQISNNNGFVRDGDATTPAMQRLMDLAKGRDMSELSEKLQSWGV